MSVLVLVYQACTPSSRLRPLWNRRPHAVPTRIHSTLVIDVREYGKATWRKTMPHWFLQRVHICLSAPSAWCGVEVCDICWRIILFRFKSECVCVKLCWIGPSVVSCGFSYIGFGFWWWWRKCAPEFKYTVRLLSFRTDCAERILRAPSGGHPQKHVGASLGTLCA